MKSGPSGPSGPTGPSGLNGGAATFGGAIPASSLGTSGDVAGNIAIELGTNTAYLCIANYTTGAADIWVRFTINTSTF